MLSTAQVPLSPAVDVADRLARLDSIIAQLGSSITPESAALLRNLAVFTAAPSDIVFPVNRTAAVLCLLYLAEGRINVVLTTRSMQLRSHPGETSFPGGRFEEDVDSSVEACALREANEEIGLPLDSSLIHLTTLSAFTSRTLLVVVPVVYFLTDARILDSLRKNPSEVDAIFYLPLEAFLGLPLSLAPSLSEKNGGEECASIELTHDFDDLIWLEDRLYRLHRFESPLIPSPVTGLTADILISVGLIGHGRETDEVAEAGESSENGEDGLGFVRRAEGQMSWREIVVSALSMTGTKGLTR